MEITITVCDICHESTNDLQPFAMPAQAPDGRWFQHHGVQLEHGKEVCPECRLAIREYHHACLAYIDIESQMRKDVDAEVARFRPIREAHAKVAEAIKQAAWAQKPHLKVEKGKGG